MKTVETTGSDNENVKEDENELLIGQEEVFKRTKDNTIKLAKSSNIVSKRKALEFPGHYPMTRKGKLKPSDSAP